MNSFSVNCKYPTAVLVMLVGSLAFSGCGGETTTPVSPNLTQRSLNDHARYSWIRDNILSLRCMDCHSASQGDGDGLDYADFDTYQDTLHVVKPGDPEHSKLYVMVQTKKMPKGMDPMPGMPNPPPAVPLTDAQVQAISDWISNGALNN